MKLKHILSIAVIGVIANTVACQKSNDDSAKPNPAAIPTTAVPQSQPALAEDLDLFQSMRAVYESSPEKILNLGGLEQGEYEADKIRIAISKGKGTPTALTLLSELNTSVEGTKVRMIKVESNSGTEEIPEIKFLVPESVHLSSVGKLHYQYRQVTVKRSANQAANVEIGADKNLITGIIQPSKSDQLVSVGLLLSQSSSEDKLPLGQVMILKRNSALGTKLNYVSKFSAGSFEIMVSSILAMRIVDSETTTEPRREKSKKESDNLASVIDIENLHTILDIGMFTGKNSRNQHCTVRVSAIGDSENSYYLEVWPAIYSYGLARAIFEIGNADEYKGWVRSSAANLSVEGPEVDRMMDLIKQSDGSTKVRIKTTFYKRHIGKAAADCVITPHP